MRRMLELFLYAVMILYFIVRYAGEETVPQQRAERRPLPESGLPKLPDTGLLPRESGGPVTVQVYTAKKNSVGTAFLVNTSGTYVTARHVVDGCAQVYLFAGLGRLERVLSVTNERSRDFAVLKTTRFEVTPFNLSATSPKRGETGFFMGYPQGKPADVSARVIGSNEMRSIGRYTMREPVIAWVETERRPRFDGTLGGLSGGPVLNAEGHVVGSAVAEAPRRGRIYSTHPRVFRETGLWHGTYTDRAAPNGINKVNFEQSGARLRRARSIAQVYCKAG